MKNIFLVAPDSVGILSLALQHLRQRKDMEIDFTDLVLSSNERFRYKNTGQRLHNFYLKNFRGKNLKQVYYNKFIQSKIQEQKAKYDTIVIIRPDLLNDETLQLLRNKTNHYIAYYWDSADFFPRKKNIASFFDKVYSFDKADCITYGYTPITNFYISEENDAAINVQAYGLLSYDKRKTQLEKIAAVLQATGISYCIKTYSQKPFESNYLTRLDTVLDYKAMLQEISHCQVLIEVQKEGQQGLTFRPFEALGMEKKMITNNPLIKEYDFYCEENICVVETEKIEIPTSFFSTPYKKIDLLIKKKYHLDNWFDTLISPL
jgi:hypothetical protein